MVNFREFIEKHQIKIFCVVFILFVFFLGLLYGYELGRPKERTPVITVPTATKENPTAGTTVTVRPKENPNDPDLILDNKYIAKINGKTFEVPTITKEAQSTGTDGSATGTRTEQTKVETVLDVSGLVNSQLPKWEIGTGITLDSNGKPSIPIAIQRNYKTNKAIEITATFDPKEKAQLKEVILLHKWKF